MVSNYLVSSKWKEVNSEQGSTGICFKKQLIESKPSEPSASAFTTLVVKFWFSGKGSHYVAQAGTPDLPAPTS